MTETLKEHFQKGFFSDTYVANYNLDIFHKIALRYTDLIKLDDNDKKLFAYLQKSAEIQLFLCLSKCYENPKSGNKTRSLKTLQKKYNNDCKKKSIRIIKYNFLSEESKEILSPKQLKSLNLGEFFDSTLETFDDRFNSTWKNIKLYRDKYLAHNELSDGYSVDKDKIKELIEFNKAVINIIGNELFNTSYISEQNNEFNGGMNRQTNFLDSLLDSKLNKQKV